MKRPALCAACIAACAGGAAHAQLVVANDQTAATNAMYYIDLTTNTSTAILSGAQSIAWGMAYAAGSNTLYWNDGGTLRQAAFNQGGLTPSAGVQMTFNGSAVNFTGLAWHAGRLIGFRSITAPGLYDINPLTGETSMLVATPTGTDLGGLDADGGRLYGLNDGMGLSGRGLYDIDINSNSYNLLAPYPAGDTDIDGLAVGGGRAYWVNDVGSQQILVYNLTSGEFEAPVANPFGTGGIFSAGAYIVPAPAAAGVLGLGALAGLRRRR